MRIKYFEYAKEIAQSGSISKAAENLYISQQALSESLKLLEDALGFRIFSRSNKGVKPTPEGEQFLQDLDVIFPILSRWKQLGEKKDAVETTIYLQYLLNDLMMHEPLKGLQMQNVDWEPCAIYDVLERSRRKKDALGILMVTEGTDTEENLLEWTKEKGCKADKLSKCHMCVVLQKDDSLCDKQQLYRKDFTGKQLVSGKIFGRTSPIQRFAEATGLAAYLLPETINVMLYLATSESGTFTYVPREIVQRSSQVKAGNLILRELEQDKDKEMAYYLLYHEEYQNQNQTIIEIIKNYFLTITKN